MNIRLAILSSVLVVLCVVPLLAREKTDILVMKNGDRMTCEIKGLDAGVLYVSLDYIDGTAFVDWSKVARLESKQLFVVKVQDGSVYTGPLRTPESDASRPVTILVVESRAGEAAIERSHVVQMIATSDKFWQRFSGELSFGSIYSKGNQSTQYTLGSGTAYVRERWRAGARFDSNLSASKGATTSTRNSLDLSTLHLLPWHNWFYSGLGTFLQSSEQRIALQSTAGFGLGHYLKNTNRATISVLGGVAWQNTRYQNSPVAPGNQNIAAALLDVEAKLFKFSRTNLDLSVVILPGVSDPGRVRFSTNDSYYIKLFKNLKWNISFYGNWDNQPPPGFSGSDYGSSAGISWTFGLK